MGLGRVGALRDNSMGEMESVYIKVLFWTLVLRRTGTLLYFLDYFCIVRFLFHTNKLSRPLFCNKQRMYYEYKPENKLINQLELVLQAFKPLNRQGLVRYSPTSSSKCDSYRVH